MSHGMRADFDAEVGDFAKLSEVHEMTGTAAARFIPSIRLADQRSDDEHRAPESKIPEDRQRSDVKILVGIVEGEQRDSVGGLGARHSVKRQAPAKLAEFFGREAERAVGQAGRRRDAVKESDLRACWNQARGALGSFALHLETLDVGARTCQCRPGACESKGTTGADCSLKAALESQIHRATRPSHFFRNCAPAAGINRVGKALRVCISKSASSRLTDLCHR